MASCGCPSSAESHRRFGRRAPPSPHVGHRLQQQQRDEGGRRAHWGVPDQARVYVSPTRLLGGGVRRLPSGSGDPPPAARE